MDRRMTDDTLDPRALVAAKKAMREINPYWLNDPALEVAITAYEAAKAALPAASPWRPIAEAPRDGTWFLGYRPKAEVGRWIRVVAIRWDSEFGDFVWPDNVYDAYAPPGDRDEDDLYFSGGTFTHWMPLPAEPGAEATVPEAFSTYSEDRARLIELARRVVATVYYHGSGETADAPEDLATFVLALLGGKKRVPPSEPQPPAAAPDRDLARRLAEGLQQGDALHHSRRGTLLAEARAAGLLGDGR